MTYVTLSPIGTRDLYEGSENVLDRISLHGFPSVDLYEDNANLYADVELPGYTKDQIKITVHEDVLTIEGERKANRANGHRTLYSERTYGPFSRSFTLPVEVDTTKVEAKYTNGILQVTMPKSNPRNIEKTIEIK